MKKYLLSALILILAFFGATIFTHAQTDASATASGSVTVTAGGSTAGTGGITFPIVELGNCANKDECRAYCSDTSHIDACTAFGQAHGLIRKEEAARAKQFKDTLEKDGGPGGCKTAQDCRAFCGQTENLQVCLDFAKAHGAKGEDIDQGEKILETLKAGGSLPGGCTSRESCEAYCNNASHRDECFKFAQDHGLVKPRELKDTRDGLVRLRTGIENAPSEVRKCIESSLGSSTLDQVQSGTLTPNSEVGQSVKKCFTQSGETNDPRIFMKKLPPGVAQCAEEKIGADFKAMEEGTKALTPETSDAIRVCFAQDRFSGDASFGNSEGQGNAGNPESSGQDSQGNNEEQQHGVQNFLRSAPSELTDCMKQNLGDDFGKLQSGEISTKDIKSRVQNCFSQFRPSMPMQGHDEGGNGGNHGMMPPQDGSQGMIGNNSQLKECFASLGIDASAQMQTGGMNPDMAAKIKECMSRHESQDNGGNMQNGNRGSDSNEKGKPMQNRMPMPVQSLNREDMKKMNGTPGTFPPAQGREFQGEKMPPQGSMQGMQNGGNSFGSGDHQMPPSGGPSNPPANQGGNPPGGSNPPPSGSGGQPSSGGTPPPSSFSHPRSFVGSIVESLKKIFGF